MEWNKLKRKGITALMSIASVVYGFFLGVEWYDDSIYGKVAKIILFGEK